MTRETKGIVIILSIYLVGEGLSRLIGGFVPGSVLGMILLFILLQAKWVAEEDIKGICNFILSNMMLFLVPVCAGLMVSYKYAAGSWLAIIATILISTTLVMVVVGWVQQFLGRRWRR